MRGSGAPGRTGHVSADANEQEMHLWSKLVSAGRVIAIQDKNGPIIMSRFLPLKVLLIAYLNDTVDGGSAAEIQTRLD